MTLPLDPAAVEARLNEVEQRLNGRSWRGFSEPWLIATCRALLAEIAHARAALEVAEAGRRQYEANGSVAFSAASREYGEALARYRAAKAKEATNANHPQV